MEMMNVPQEVKDEIILMILNINISLDKMVSLLLSHLLTHRESRKAIFL
jgi:hypothetical protein